MRKVSLGLLVMVSGFFTSVSCGSKRADFDAGVDQPDGDIVIDTDSGFGGGDTNQSDVPVVVDKCHVPPDNMSGNAPTCMMPPVPPNSFNPKLKWSWDAPMTGGSCYLGSMVTPLVANLNDDNKDGEINLCDIPDVLVTSCGGPPSADGAIYMLRGSDGKLEVTFDGTVDGSVNPALGDLDGDGIPDVVAVDKQGHIVIYEHTGKIKTVSTDVGTWKQNFNSYCTAIAIYDLDADGKPEIMVGFEVFDNKGKRLWGHDVSQWQGHYWCPAMTAADIDGDGKLEAIMGNAAYKWNGQMIWSINGPPGQPQVANFDKTSDPEIFLAREDGNMIVKAATGAVLMPPYKPNNEANSPNCWNKPSAVHDFNGDGRADLNMSSCFQYGVITLNGWTPSLLWGVTVNDNSGLASSTAFDFLGKGIADPVYGDQVALYVLEGKTGQQFFTEPRASGTLIEYPVVADIDNNGSADILVVSNTNYNQQSYKHTIEAWQDAQDRWIPTRRIWNQHAYHVTNVREDGTIPKVMAKSWQQLNTFRCNSQIQPGGDCMPAPPNPK